MGWWQRRRRLGDFIRRICNCRVSLVLSKCCVATDYKSRASGDFDDMTEWFEPQARFDIKNSPFEVEVWVRGVRSPGRVNDHGMIICGPRRCDKWVNCQCQAHEVSVNFINGNRIRVNRLSFDGFWWSARQGGRLLGNLVHTWRTGTWGGQCVVGRRHRLEWSGNCGEWFFRLQWNGLHGASDNELVGHLVRQCKTIHAKAGVSGSWVAKFRSKKRFC